MTTPTRETRTAGTSEAVTRNIRVSVEAQYSPAHSHPANQQWFFLYTIRISNEGQETVQLISRHWLITDANDRVDEVRGLGVVGQQPVLAPGESFEYTSGCPLSTAFGMMKGTYHMVTDRGERFETGDRPVLPAGTVFHSLKRGHASARSFRPGIARRGVPGFRRRDPLKTDARTASRAAGRSPPASRSAPPCPGA